jgi:hypothetical protein
VVGRQRDEPEIEAFLWDYSPNANVEHIAGHSVTPLDVQNVRDNEPHFFDARPEYFGCVMLGPNMEGRYLYVAMFETQIMGVWQVITAHWLSHRRGERLYFKE